VETKGTAGQATDENIIWRKRFVCWVLWHTESLDYRYMKVTKLSALGSGRLYLAAHIPSTDFC